MRGYLLFAVNSETTDYVKLAYACALSIKLTQPQGYNNVSIVVSAPEQVNDRFKIFDHVITYQGPGEMDVRSRGYDFSPYDETVLLDSDLLFLNPVDHYWTAAESMELLIATRADSYRQQQIHYGHYRKIFEANKLDDVYSAWTYFKKTADVKEFFNVVKLLTDNSSFANKLIQRDNKLENLPTDEAFAMAIEITDIDAVRPEWGFPRITHMKGMVQQWTKSSDNWHNHVRMIVDDAGQIKIGVWQQTDILHYVTKDLISDNIINLLEAAYERH
jgi:hypothetical protein